MALWLTFSNPWILQEKSPPVMKSEAKLGKYGIAERGICAAMLSCEPSFESTNPLFLMLSSKATFAKFIVPVPAAYVAGVAGPSLESQCG